jgi:hypothetical protein
MEEKKKSKEKALFDFSNLTFFQLDRVREDLNAAIYALRQKPPDVNTILYDIKNKGISISFHAVDLGSNDDIVYFGNHPIVNSKRTEILLT